LVYEFLDRVTSWAYLEGTVTYSQNPVQELSGGSSPTVSANIFTGLDIDENFARTDSNGSVVYLNDALGSTIGLSESPGSIASSYSYQPFGATTTGGAASTSTYQFTGRENDGTGLYYSRARYYSPTLQRFISQDPIGFAGGDSNLYAYVANNPITMIDPFGLADSSSYTYGEIRHGTNATAAADKAAWQNIVKASGGTNQTGGGNFMCVGTQNCWFVHSKFACQNGSQHLTTRSAPLAPSGTVTINGHTLYFYYDPLKGWDNAADYRSACQCHR
jgi:RHS repeat-associated protein